MLSVALRVKFWTAVMRRSLSAAERLGAPRFRPVTVAALCVASVAVAKLVMLVLRHGDVRQIDDLWAFMRGSKAPMFRQLADLMDEVLPDAETYVLRRDASARR
jgi:hypothetical protein